MPFTAASGPVIVPQTQTLTVSAARTGVASPSKTASRARLRDLLMWTSGRRGVGLDGEGERAAAGGEVRHPPAEPAEQGRQAPRLEHEEEDDEEAEGHLAEREEQAGD